MKCHHCHRHYEEETIHTCAISSLKQRIKELEDDVAWFEIHAPASYQALIAKKKLECLTYQ